MLSDLVKGGIINLGCIISLAATVNHASAASAIAKETGVAVSTLSEFMSGADMRLKNASKIAAYLGLELKRRR